MNILILGDGRMAQALQVLMHQDAQIETAIFPHNRQIEKADLLKGSFYRAV